MLNKFHDKAQKVIALTESIAFDLGQSSVGSEHLLLSFLKTKDCKLKALLEKENINFDSIKEEVIKLFGEKTSKPFYMEYTLSFKKILENAILIAKKRNEEKVSIDVLSIALLELNDCVAYEILSKKTNKINQICQEIKKQLKRTSDLDNIFDLKSLIN